MKKTLIVIGVIAVIVLMYGFSTYNTLVTLSVDADTKWQNVEVDYQRRLDLIPGLVESAKGVMKQETAVFTAIADARTKYAGAGTPAEKAAAANQVEGSLARLLVVMENYPQLKSSDVVQTFMSQNEGTENRIGVARTRYNESVQAYNLKVMKVPSSLIAAVTGFDERAYFEAAEGADKAPAVQF